MKNSFFDKSIPLFLLVGVANTLFSAVIMFLLEFMGYWPSTAIAYIAGGILSFFLNRRFTFESKEPLLRSGVKFAVNLVVCYVIAYLIAQPAAGWFLGAFKLTAIWQERITKLFGMGLYTVMNYFGQRFFAFKKSK